MISNKQIKQEKRGLDEKPRKKLLPRRESKKPENVKRRKRLLMRPDERKLRKRQMKLPVSKLSKPFQTLSLIILT